MPDVVFIASVAIGSALGGVMRVAVAGLVVRALGASFPWGTIVVNATGALAIGVLAAMALGPGYALGQPSLWTLVVTGCLGSYTTVSSFSLQTLALAREGQGYRAAGNVLLSLLLCLSAVTAGFLATEAITGGAA